jgi:hypothetical protein
MMLRKLILATVLTGTALVAACSHDDRGTALNTAMPADFGFHFLDEGPSAKLAFGQANSDNVGLMLQCAKGSRTVEVSDIIRTTSAPTLMLASGGQQSNIAVETQPGPGAALAVGTAPSGSGALAGFRRSGQIEVSYAGARYAMTAKPQERADVERFFAACDRVV